MDWTVGKRGCSEYFSKCGCFRIYRSGSFWYLQDKITPSTQAWHDPTAMDWHEPIATRETLGQAKRTAEDFAGIFRFRQLGKNLIIT